MAKSSAHIPLALVVTDLLLKYKSVCCCRRKGFPQLLKTDNRYLWQTGFVVAQCGGMSIFHFCDTMILPYPGLNCHDKEVYIDNPEHCTVNRRIWHLCKVAVSKVFPRCITVRWEGVEEEVGCVWESCRFWVACVSSLFIHTFIIQECESVPLIFSRPMTHFKLILGLFLMNEHAIIRNHFGDAWQIRWTNLGQ